MKIFLSALEGQKTLPYTLVERGIKMKYNLMSFYGICRNENLANYIRDHSQEIMIDSGAFSFRRGAKVEWDNYTQRYANFIQSFDRPNVVGFFEMDIDNIVGYKKVLELRKVLTSVSDKIIPVWHPNRGIADFKNMCSEFHDKIVAITGVGNREVNKSQYVLFLKEAHKYNCKLHCLGMTNTEILNKVPFDYVDSSSWLQCSVYGNIIGERKKLKHEFSKENREVILRKNYLQGIEMQEYYFNYWKRYL